MRHFYFHLSGLYTNTVGFPPSLFFVLCSFLIAKHTVFCISSVRLACVRHAASVHPEPGSNSLVYFILPASSDADILLNCSLFQASYLCFLVSLHCVFFVYAHFIQNLQVLKTLSNFQVLFAIQFSRFFFAANFLRQL